MPQQRGSADLTLLDSDDVIAALGPHWSLQALRRSSFWELKSHDRSIFWLEYLQNLIEAWSCNRKKHFISCVFGLSTENLNQVSWPSCRSVGTWTFHQKGLKFFSFSVSIFTIIGEPIWPALQPAQCSGRTTKGRV